MKHSIKLATYNVNGIRSRLGNLLDWLSREIPDIVCLQELKAADAAFPIAAINAAGYEALWHGQPAWNGVAILSRGSAPVESRKSLPGNSPDTQSRYLEAAVQGIIVGCLYLPNGNPWPGAKFEYKLKWFEHLIEHASTLYTCGHPVVLAGDFNVVPTDLDIYNTRSWLKNALLQPESRACYARLLKQGWIDSLRHKHPGERIYTFWDYFRRHWETDSGLRIDHILLNAPLGRRLLTAAWIDGYAEKKVRAIMRPHGSRVVSLRRPDHAVANFCVAAPRVSIATRALEIDYWYGYSHHVWQLKAL